VLRHIQHHGGGGALESMGSELIPRLIDGFEHSTGPNGVHRCISESCETTEGPIRSTVGNTSEGGRGLVKHTYDDLVSFSNIDGFPYQGRFMLVEKFVRRVLPFL